MYMYLGDRGHTPGTVLKVRCPEFPLIEHWGMCYWPGPFTGQPRIIHGMKNDVFRITFMPEFHRGQESVVAWTPQIPDERTHAIARMELLLGRPWDLFKLNCEQGVMWASLARKAASGQKTVPNQGTVTDINIVSTLLPYCDAMFVDNGCRALLHDIPKTHALPYPCRVFSPNSGTDFIRYLTEIRDSATSDHLRLVEQVYGPDPLKPPTSIYGVGRRRRSGS